jgi:hypothetical protein
VGKHTAQAVALSGAEHEAFLATALADGKVKRLQSFLQTRGYTLDTAKADVTRVDLDSKKAVMVALLPFMAGDGSAAARIAFWDGHVDGVADRNAVAIQGEDTVFVVKNNTVTTASKGQLYKQLRNPLLRLQGPTPKTAPADKEQVTDITPDGRMVTSSSVQALASGCRSVDVPKTMYTTLGFVAYKFWQRKYWCYGSTVYSVNVSTYMSNVDPLFYYREIAHKWDQYYDSNRSHDSMRQARVENCVLKYGCISNTYPAVQIQAHLNGNYTPRTWH